MSRAICEVLFLDEDGEPLQFSVRGTEFRFASTIDMIKKGGGMVLARRSGPHTIVLDHPLMSVYTEGEYYNSKYISDCCEANALLDLNKYRLNKFSKYVKDYDANLILLKKKSWDDIPLASEKEILASDSDVSGIFEEHVATFSQCSSSIKPGARPYSNAEKLAIINTIIEKKAYALVGGNAIWVEIEEEKIFEGRSWQSLKEHFKKRILPKIDTFGLPPKVVKNFKTRKPY